ncbi:MAG: T9SS type A sorting domain-containing protein [Flavobacterium sp.]|uniref:T9SS type A sorting domain-containing protein n=1 Tax=Flavobacterium sp. TaxID=239 RepID=UPI00326466F2
MKKQLLLIVALLFSFQINYSQVISIIGNTSPSGSWSIDTDLTTTDNITYTLLNATLTTATGPTTGLKFRQGHDWPINWGGNFPNGTGTQDGPNIQTIAGTYDITFNRSNGTYTFIASGTEPHNIGIWGPAVDSINGFVGPDVNMNTTDNITYTLSGFYFSSGTAYFRENDATTNVWGSVAFPTGTAVLSGPSIQVTGGEWYVTFNRITGAYSFVYPGIGILGTATSAGWGPDDIDLTTTDGFEYTILNLSLTDGFAKFRKDDSWDTNWGSLGFPSATGIQNGPEIPVTAGTYDIVFQKSSGHYLFTNTLSNHQNLISNVKIYPNPTNNIWNFTHTATIDSIELFDIAGKTIQSFAPNATQFQLDGSDLSNGVYFVKIKSGLDFAVQKIIRN